MTRRPPGSRRQTWGEDAPGEGVRAAGWGGGDALILGEAQWGWSNALLGPALERLTQLVWVTPISEFPLSSWALLTQQGGVTLRTGFSLQHSQCHRGGGGLPWAQQNL